MFSASKTAGPSGYNINNSLRFRASASANLSRTPSSSTNRNTWTVSLWAKRSNIGGWGVLLNSGTTTNFEYFTFRSDDTLQWVTYSGAILGNLITTQVFRDPSAWYHIVFAFDSTQATSSNRLKLYINGSQVTAFGTATYPSLNYNSYINLNQIHNIGRDGFGDYFDGYMAEYHFIDGQALTPSSFGSTNATTGVWQPAKYTGSYGTNGFYLPFSDIGLTSGSNTGLGKDFSGNSNYWTTNNISVTAGTTYDAMTDSPTNTSATVANYAVMSPIMAGSITVTDGNLSVQKVGASYGNTNSTIAFPTSGKYYFEATIVSGTNGNNQQMGMGTQGGGYYFVLDCYYSSNLIRKVADGVATTGYGTASVGTVIGVAVDADNGKAYLAINNTWIDSSSPTGGTGGYSMTAGQVYSGFFQAYNSGVSAYNFGQRPFAYTPPTGYVALNTFNLPTSTIVKGNSYFDSTTWTGNGNTSRTITNAASFRPDFVWLKERDIAIDHILYDSIRGPSTSSASKALCSNTTVAEGSQNDNSTYGYLDGFTSSGFTVTRGSDGTVSYTNKNNGTYVGWQWQAGQGSTSSNTSGSITSTVSVNTTAGFSIVTYTGNGSAGATVGHGLGVVPKMFIVKNRVQGTYGNWNVWHTALSGSQYLTLNATDAAGTNNNRWNGTVPTSTVFYLGADTFGNTNKSGDTYVAYCWAEIAGFSKFGSYTGNGSADGPFIFLGFRPKFVMIKSSAGVADDWTIIDTSRSTYNLCAATLKPNSSAAEDTNVGTIRANIDILSNGFKIRQPSDIININTGTYIYAAFAENPFKNALAR